jgi:hypothetical protein
VFLFHILPPKEIFLTNSLPPNWVKQQQQRHLPFHHRLPFLILPLATMFELLLPRFFILLRRDLRRTSADSDHLLRRDLRRETHTKEIKSRKLKHWNPFLLSRTFITVEKILDLENSNILPRYGVVVAVLIVVQRCCDWFWAKKSCCEGDEVLCVVKVYGFLIANFINFLIVFSDCKVHLLIPFSDRVLGLEFLILFSGFLLENEIWYF